MKQILSIIRANDWWNNIIPPVIGFYFLGKLHSLNYTGNNWQLFWLIQLMVWIAVFGFTLGEWSDIKDDKKIGKKNHLAGRPFILKAFIIVTSLSMILVSVVYVYMSDRLKELVILQLICFVLYSVPPIRLKRFKFTSLILDATYSGTLMYLLAFSLTQIVVHEPIQNAIVVWGLMKGARNYLLHTLNDANQDQQLKIQSYGNTISKEKVLKWITEYMIPIEIIAMLFILILMKVHHLKLMAFYIVVLIFAAFHKSKSIELGQYKFASNINIYHEVAFLLITVLLFSLNNYLALIYFVLFILIFPSNFSWITSGFKRIIKKRP